MVVGGTVGPSFENKADRSRRTHAAQRVRREHRDAVVEVCRS